MLFQWRNCRLQWWRQHGLAATSFQSAFVAKHLPCLETLCLCCLVSLCRLVSLCCLLFSTQLHHAGGTSHEQQPLDCRFFFLFAISIVKIIKRKLFGMAWYFLDVLMKLFCIFQNALTRPLFLRLRWTPTNVDCFWQLSFASITRLQAGYVTPSSSAASDTTWLQPGVLPCCSVGS